jgi:hypothetical protein
MRGMNIINYQQVFAAAKLKQTPPTLICLSQYYSAFRKKPKSQLHFVQTRQKQTSLCATTPFSRIGCPNNFLPRSGRNFSDNCVQRVV